MTKFKINITKEVLERSANCGKERIGNNCAIAVAINDLFPASWIDGNSIRFVESVTILDEYFTGFKSHFPFSIAEVRLPIEAINFVDKFDCNAPECRLLMKPFSFEIDVPDIIIDRISIDEVKKILETSTTMELINC